MSQWLIESPQFLRTKARRSEVEHISPEQVRAYHASTPKEQRP